VEEPIQVFVHAHTEKKEKRARKKQEIKFSLRFGMWLLRAAQTKQILHTQLTNQPRAQ